MESDAKAKGEEMKKEDLMEIANSLRDKAESDYYGKEPQADSVLRDLQYKLKPILSYQEWHEQIANRLEDCMRMVAGLASWLRHQDAESQRIARAAFDEIKRETISLIIAAVNTPHDEKPLETAQKK